MSLSGKRPILTTLPCCSMGGFFSIWRMRASTSPPPSHELPLRRAATRTVPAAPGSTRIDPDPDVTERSTAPETLSVRSNAPSGVWAAAGRENARHTVATSAARDEIRRNERVVIMTTHDLPGSLDEKLGGSVARPVS